MHVQVWSDHQPLGMRYPRYQSSWMSEINDGIDEVDSLYALVRIYEEDLLTISYV